MRFLAALIVWAGWSGATHAAPKIAVLEASGPAKTSVEVTMGWTDAVREAVLRAAPKGWAVLTRENIEAFLPPGVDLADCDGECEITTGRSIGAEYVVTTRLTPIEDGWRITVAVHATINGRFVGQARVDAASDQIDAGLAGAAAKAMRTLWPTSTTTGESIAILTAAPIRWYGERVLRVNAPDGALIHAFGRSQGRAPTRIPVKGLSRIRIRAEAEGYRSRVFDVELARRSSAVEIKLERVTADLDVDLPFADAEVIIDGGLPSTKARHHVSPGRHVVEVRHPCMRTHSHAFEAKAGDYIDHHFEPELTCGRIRFEASVDRAEVTWKGEEHALPYTTPPMPVETVMVYIEAPGHRPVRRAVTIPESGVEEERFELDPLWSAVSVRVQRWDARPCNGTLKVDGKTVGELPWSGRLLAGRHRLQADCAPKSHTPLRTSVRLNGSAQAVVLREPGLTKEFVLRTDGARAAQMVIRGWFDERRPGQFRFGLGASLGLAIADDEVLPIYGVDLAVALSVTRWLELGVGANVGGGPEECEPSETDTSGDCSFAYASGYAGARGYFGRMVVELGWAATGDTSADTSDGRNSGPHIAVGGAF